MVGRTAHVEAVPMMAMNTKQERQRRSGWLAMGRCVTAAQQPCFTSMASAAASALWPSSMACSAPTCVRKAGAAMALFTASARPMWRWMLGSALSWDANSFSSVRLRSAAYAWHTASEASLPAQVGAVSSAAPSALTQDW